MIQAYSSTIPVRLHSNTKTARTISSIRPVQASQQHFQSEEKVLYGEVLERSKTRDMRDMPNTRTRCTLDSEPLRAHHLVAAYEAIAKNVTQHSPSTTWVA